MSDASVPTTTLAWKVPAAKKGIFRNWASKKPEVPTGPKVPRLCGSKPKDPQAETPDVPAPIPAAPNAGLEASEAPALAAAPTAFSFKFEEPTPMNSIAVCLAPSNPFLPAQSSAPTVDPHRDSKAEEASGECMSGSSEAPTDAQTTAQENTETSVEAPPSVSTPALSFSSERNNMTTTPAAGAGGGAAWKTPRWTKAAAPHASESGETVVGLFRPKPEAKNAELCSTDGLDSTVEVAQRFVVATAAPTNTPATAPPHAQPCGAEAPAEAVAAAAAPFTFEFRTDQADDDVVMPETEQWHHDPPKLLGTPAHAGDAVFHCTGAAARRQQFYKLVSNTLQGDRARLLTVLIPPAAVSGSVALHIAQEFLPAFSEPARGVSVPTIDCRPWALTEDTRCALMHDSVCVPPGQISLLQLTTGELWLRSITLEQATPSDLCSSVLPRLVWLRSLKLHNLHPSTTIAQVVTAFSPHCPHLTSFESTGTFCAAISAADAEAVCGIPQLTALSLRFRVPLRCSLPLSRAPHLEDIALDVDSACLSRMRIAENLIPVATRLKRVCLRNILSAFLVFPRATTVNFQMDHPSVFPHKSFPAARRITMQVHSGAPLDQAFAEQLRHIDELTLIATPPNGSPYVAAGVAAHAVTASKIVVNVKQNMVMSKTALGVFEQLLKKNSTLRQLKFAILAHDAAPVVRRMLEARPALDLRYDHMLAEGA